MSQQVETAFVKQYASTLSHLVQQKGSRLRATVRVEPLVGREGFFDQIGATEAVPRTTRHGQSPIVSTPHARRRVAGQDFEWGDIVDGQDRVRMLIDPTSAYLQSAMFALGRKIDDVIIQSACGTSFTGETGTTPVALPAGQKIAVAATGLTVTKLRTAKRMLDEKEVDPEEPRATLGIGSAVDLNLLTTDTTGGNHADFVPFVDSSEANASNKVPVPNFFSVAITGSSDTTPSDPATYEAMTRRLSDGTLHKMLLSEFGIGKQTVWIPAGSMTARTTSGAVSGTVETTTNKVMIKTLDFDAAAAEYAQFNVQMPKGWNEGTVSAVFVWSHAATATNFGVVWGIQALAVSDDDALDAAFGTAQTVTDTGGTTNDLYRSAESSAVTIAGTPAENDVVVFQVYRDATNGSDTMAIDARLHGVALFYTTNANTDN